MVGSLVPNDGRLSARPHDSIKTTATGELRLGLVPERDAILHIPQTNGNQSALPLFVMLHGATQSAEPSNNRLGGRRVGLWLRRASSAAKPER